MSAYDDFCRTLRSRGPTLNLLFEQARVSPEREGDAILRDAFAGAIVYVLHGMLTDYWNTVGGTKDQWKHSGTRVAGYSIGQILAAALDNSRQLTRPRSIKVLCAVLGIESKKTSKHPPFRGNACWQALEAVTGGGGYGALEAQVRAFAAALDEKTAS